MDGLYFESQSGWYDWVCCTEIWYVWTETDRKEGSKHRKLKGWLSVVKDMVNLSVTMILWFSSWLSRQELERNHPYVGKSIVEVHFVKCKNLLYDEIICLVLSEIWYENILKDTNMQIVCEKTEFVNWDDWKEFLSYRPYNNLIVDQKRERLNEFLKELVEDVFNR